MSAITKFITAYASGSTLYDIFRDADGQVLHNTLLTLGTWGASSQTRVDYAFALTDKSGDIYTADPDDSFPIGTVLYRSTYLQGEAAPADTPTDTLLYGPIPVEWTGESVIVDGETASITNLCNYAYAKLGGAWQQNKLASYNETTDSAELCQRLWPNIRKEVLIRGSKGGVNWEEALKFSETGAELADANIPEMANWDYAFTLPSDCLRVIRQVSELDRGTEYAFKVMRGMLLSDSYGNEDADVAYIEYIYDNDNVDEYGPALYNAMATLLASELAGATVSAERRAELRAEFESLVMQLASNQQQAQVYFDDAGEENIAGRRHNSYGRET